MTEEKKIEIIRHYVLGRSLDDISIVLKVEKSDIQKLIDRNPKLVERIRSEYIAHDIPVAKRKLKWEAYLWHTQAHHQSHWLAV